MHIALIHSNLEQTDEGKAKIDPLGPKRMADTINAVRKALEKADHDVTLVETDYNLLNRLENMDGLDFIFNLSAGISDKLSQANVVGMLEILNIPMLGSGLTTHILGLHKEITKALLTANNIRTARYQLLTNQNELIRDDFIFPLIVKPDHEGSGVGVTDSSKVDTPEQLQQIIQEKLALHKQELLIEEFLPGREFTVGVLGNKTLEILPISETIFKDDGPQLLTYEMKLDVAVISDTPADISNELKDEIEAMVKHTYRILRCQDFARIDVRLDAEGKPNIIELNTYPGLSPEVSFLPMIAEVGGYSYDELINRLIEIASDRISTK